MSSNRVCRLAALTLFAAAAATGAAAVCPPVLATVETAQPVPAWNGTTVRAKHAFERISVYNGKAGGQEFELAPDDQKQEGSRITQTWNLKGYRSMNVFLRCRYHDTAVVLFRDLAPDIATCTLRFAIDGRGGITGKSEMECR